jgi:flagellar protein FliL
MSAPTVDRYASGTQNNQARKGGKPGGDDPAAAPGRKRPFFKSKKFLIALIVVAAGGGVGYKTFMPSKPGPPQGGDVVALEPTTLNLADGHYLKIAIAIQLVKGNASATSFFTSQAAELTIDEFSDRTVTSLASNTARRKLTDELTKRIQAAYPGEVYDVFVTQYVTE